MKQIAKIALFVVLLLGGVVQLGWCDENTDQQWDELTEKVVVALNKGDYRQGILFAEQARDYALKHFGAEHSDTLTAMNNLAFLYQAQGRFSEAESLYNEALQIMKRVLGEEHPDTLTASNNLAGLYESQGHYSEAELLFEQVVRIRKKVQGEKHPDTLTSVNNLAMLYQVQGRYKEAEPLFIEALRLSETVLGKEHPDTLTSLNNLAALYQAQGRYKEAAPLFQDAVKMRKNVQGEKHPDTLACISNLATLYRDMGRYKEAEQQYQQAYQLTKEVLGENHPNTLIILNNLSGVYEALGRYNEAESGYEEVLKISEDILSKKHPETLISRNNLAGLYYRIGRYPEAEKEYRQAYQISKEVLGTEHPYTLTIRNNTATLYQDQGRYSEAESIFKEVLDIRRKLLGENHSDTLASMNNLATLYNFQKRYSDAEPLFQQVLKIKKDVLGGEHPNILATLNNLAALYQAQGNYTEAESRFKEVLQLSEDILGKEHTDTLIARNNLAQVYESQDRYSDAEPLYKQVFEHNKEIFGMEHPNTLISLNNLAALYDLQGRYSEAEPIYKQVFELSKKVLGENHPNTLSMHTNYIAMLINTNRSDTALEQLREHEKKLLPRSFQELYTSSSEKVRRQYLTVTTYFQNMVLTLATKQVEEKYQLYAAEVMLRWKQVYAEESSIQHKLLNLSNDPEAEKLRTELAATQANASKALYNQMEKQSIRELVEKANQDEMALLALARHLRTGLEVKDVTLDKVLAALPQHSGLIEYRLFFPVDFKTGKGGKSHLAALLLLADPKAKQRFVFRDLGPFAEIDKHLHDETAETYKRLLGPFDEHIKNLKQLYIAPDGSLSLLSFASLRLPDGRFLAERQQINRLQTGRDLIENGKDFPRGKGLVAIGGAEYGEPPADQTESTPELAASYQQRAAQMLRAGVDPLPNSEPEVQNIKTIFTNNIAENAQVFLGENANEYNLKHLKQPPRILHLSTHGFYLAKEEQSRLADEAPLLLSGLALAGANNGLQGKLDKQGDDGLLYSLEVLGLNLHGTELVSLSACDTGKGVVDYSEGVYGLVRAFRTAGAENVLMTLTPVGDKSSRDVMETFYENWLYPDDPEKKWFDGEKKSSRTPAEALHQTRLEFIHDNKPVQDWSPYVLVGR